MSQASVEIKVVCQNHIAKGTKPVNGLPWRNWKISLVAVQQGNEQKGRLSTLLDHVEYILHPSFENPRHAIYEEPYSIQEKGWGEFDLQIVLHFIHGWADPQVIWFDLNFAKASYHTIANAIIYNPTTELLALLHEQGSSSSPDGSPLTSSLSLGPNIASVAPPSASPRTQSLPEHDDLYASDYERGDKHGHANGHTNGLGDTGSKRDSVMAIDPSESEDHESDEDSLSSWSEDPDMEAALIEDDVYGPNDIDGIHPIHSQYLDPDTCRAWGVPNHFNMQELARRLSCMSDEQALEFQRLVRQNLTDDSTLEEDEGELVLDLYSLGPALLTQLWDYTESFRETV